MSRHWPEVVGVVLGAVTAAGLLVVTVPRVVPLLTGWVLRRRVYDLDDMLQGRVGGGPR
jgi:hypothetical protein